MLEENMALELGHHSVQQDSSGVIAQAEQCA